MQRRVAVEGDVSQLVAGNVIHEAPASVQHQNNNVTYNVQAGPAPEYLLWRQRQAISKKVNEVVSATGLDRMEIYQAVLDNHGANSMKTMPAAKFRPIMDDLSTWLNEAVSRREAANDQTPGQATSVAPSDRASRPPRPVRRPAFVALHWVLTLTACAMGGFQIFAQQGAALADEPDLTCHFGGKRFSVGSLTSMPPHGNFECVGDRSGSSPRWIAAKGPSSVTKRR